jgi:hypothetical protein
MFNLFRKKREIIDLGKLRKNKVILKENLPKRDYVDFSDKSDSQEGSALGFLGSMASVASNSSSDSSVEESGYEKKQKLMKILKSITERQEELSTQLYRLSQRVELLEKKLERGY